MSAPIGVGRHPLYQAAIDADDAFTAALIVQFGTKRAGTDRYRTAAHNGNTLAAGEAMQRACRAWLDHMRARS